MSIRYEAIVKRNGMPVTVGVFTDEELAWEKAREVGEKAQCEYYACMATADYIRVFSDTIKPRSLLGVWHIG